MSLYEIMLEHFAPKGSERGIFTYVLAQSDEEVYEWLKTDPRLSDGRAVYTPYQDNEQTVKHMQFIIRALILLVMKNIKIE